VKKHIKHLKVIIVLATAAALTLAVIGVAYASYLNYANNQTYTNTNPNTPYTTAPRENFWGWLGGCFGWNGNQPYAYQYTAPSNTTTQSTQPAQPYVPPTNPNQGYSSYGYGRGCMGW
jgi:hypothetical protein